MIEAMTAGYISNERTTVNIDVAFAFIELNLPVEILKGEREILRQVVSADPASSSNMLQLSRSVLSCFRIKYNKL